MRTTYNRQIRRAGLCVRPQEQRGHRLSFSPRRLALTADGHDLAQVAARIAEELELSPELVDLLAVR